MRGELKNVKKKLDDEDRAKKAAVLGEIVETTKGSIIAIIGLIQKLNVRVQIRIIKLCSRV